MRLFRCAFLAGMIFGGLSAQAITTPKKINFQGKLLDPTTDNPKNGTFSMTFALYKSPAGGTAIYSETQPSVQVTNGVFAVQIGTLSALDETLFSDASTYLGVTVSPDAEMTPRTQLLESPYAFTAHQLSQSSDILIAPGNASSTFTATGDLNMGGGINSSSASFRNGLTASSGTFTAIGTAQFSITTSSGIQMNLGTLDVTGTAGIRADDTGITLSTVDFIGLAGDPNGNAGYMYYNTSTGAIKVLDGSGQWNYVFGQSLGSQMFSTTNNTAATAAKATAATVLIVPFFLSHPLMANQMRLRVTTALGAAGDLGVYNSGGSLVLNGGASTLTTTAGLKTVAPVQTGGSRFLIPGQYYAAVTWNSTTGIVGGDSLGVAGVMNRVGTVVGGGTTLPASITPSGITAGTVNFFFELNP